MRYRIYCDESEKKGLRYSDFFGGALVAVNKIESIDKEIDDFRKKINYGGELKWSKISMTHKDIYESFVSLIFELIKRYDIKIRIFFRHNSNVPTKYKLTDNHKRKTYFYLYNQFLRHHFGLADIGKASKDVKVSIYADDIPDKEGDKIEEFKRYVCKAFSDQGIALRDEDISEVDSSKHNMLQIVDILLGAVQFKLNEKDRQRTNDGKIPNRTKAKMTIYKLVNQEIRKLEPKDRYKNFNIGVSTARINAGDKFHLPWRHWNFRPK